MDACVHCGFCLTTCPSYVLLGHEAASPRGRIHLMKSGLDARIDMNASVVRHFDTCLGCMACETACPSGVRYAPLLEGTRAAIERVHRRPLADRLFRWLLFTLLPYPARLRLAAWPMRFIPLLRRWPTLVARLPATLGAVIGLAPPVGRMRTLPSETAGVGEIRGRVGLLTGCVQRVFFGAVNEATVRVLAAEGYNVMAPADQGCCGALALHAGRDEEAKEFARRLIEIFERVQVEIVVANAAGCGSAMKEYGALLRDDPGWAERARRFAERVQDVSEVLCREPTRSVRHPLTCRVAYHDACHLKHAQRVERQPRQLLESIPGLTLLPVPESDLCCGSAGIFNLVEPEMAAALGRRKATALGSHSPDLVVTTNPGCMLQLTASARSTGRELRVRHLVEVLDAALSGDFADSHLAAVCGAEPVPRAY
jgi:glycolate oxidase iron-sulfur subunit